MSKFKINADYTIDQDQIFLLDRSLSIIGNGEIQGVENLTINSHLNSNDEISFLIYKFNNGILNPLWNKVDDLQLILVKGKGIFEISVPKTVEGCVSKEIHGVSFGESETSQTNITMEVNTENDFKANEYMPTVLYTKEGYIPADLDDDTKRPSITQFSLLHRIFKQMPHYKIGHVDDSIASLQRTYTFSNQSVYDCLQAIAEEIECIFVFDSFERIVNCYKLEDYGKDTGIFIDNTDNLAETITITGDKDSVKNCFKIEGGDETINNLIGTRLIGGNYIWKFSDYQRSQMSETLQQALIDREQLVTANQDAYNQAWDNWTTYTDKKSYYTSSMMPSFEKDDMTAEDIYNKLFGSNGKITYGCLTNKYQGEEAVAKSLLNFAKLIAPSYYTVEFLETSGKKTDNNILTKISFKAHIYLTNEYEDDGVTLKDEYTSATITLPVKNGYTLYCNEEGKEDIFTTDYYLYLKQQMDIFEAEGELSTEVVVYEPELTNQTDVNNYPYNHYSKYCINRLQSFHDAYESCSQIIAGLNSDIASDTTNILKYLTPEGSRENIYEALLGKYSRYMELIDARLQYLNNQVNNLENQIATEETIIEDIRKKCDMEAFLNSYEDGIHGDDLWIELCSFRREDTYSNSNYIAEGLTNAQISENIDLLIGQAEKEIKKACEIHYSIDTTLSNLLTMKEFEPLWDGFDVGNYLRIRIDEEVYKLQLISLTYNYDDVAHIDVSFCDIIKNDSVQNIKQILQQSQALTSNFNFVARQAEKGESANTAFTDMMNHGLSIANTMILDANNQKPLINEYGITGRKWNEVEEQYEPKQVRLINNLLCFTDNNWLHTKTALGEIYYQDPDTGNYISDYGLNAKVIIGELIMSERMKITNKSGTYTINDNGMKMTSTDGKYIHFDPNHPSILAYNGNENVLDFNSKGDGKLIISGDIKASTISGSTFTSIKCKDEETQTLSQIEIIGGNIVVSSIFRNYSHKDDDIASLILDYAYTQNSLGRSQNYYSKITPKQFIVSHSTQTGTTENSYSSLISPGTIMLYDGYYDELDDSNRCIEIGTEGIVTKEGYEITCSKINTNNLSNIQTGTSDITISNTGTLISKDVTFSKSFSSNPIVTCILKLPSAISLGTHYNYTVSNITTTGFTIEVYFDTLSVSPVVVSVDWIAVYNKNT